MTCRIAFFESWNPRTRSTCRIHTCQTSWHGTSVRKSRTRPRPTQLCTFGFMSLDAVREKATPKNPPLPPHWMESSGMLGWWDTKNVCQRRCIQSWSPFSKDTPSPEMGPSERPTKTNNNSKVESYAPLATEFTSSQAE